MSIFEDRTAELEREETKKLLRENVRRRIETLNIEIQKMEKLGQTWKGKYHELVGERRGLIDVEEGNYF